MALCGLGVEFCADEGTQTRRGEPDATSPARSHPQPDALKSFQSEELKCVPGTFKEITVDQMEII